MNMLTAEWVEKAEEDFDILQRERRARKNPSYNGICFHAQQCVEKYLKALLQEASLPIERTHNLTVLLNAIVPTAPLLEPFRKNMKWLSAYASNFRYPGPSAIKEDAVEAYAFCASVRDAIRSHLGCS